jgi:hypothetical protein
MDSLTAPPSSLVFKGTKRAYGSRGVDVAHKVRFKDDVTTFSDVDDNESISSTAVHSGLHRRSH